MKYVIIYSYTESGDGINEYHTNSKTSLSHEMMENPPNYIQITTYLADPFRTGEQEKYINIYL